MNRKSSTVVVALSGGVDSSLGAALLKQEGWEVTGLHLLLPASPSRAGEKVARVEQIAHRLGIPVDFLEVRDLFTKAVMGPFTVAYMKGLTPNPCVLCNPVIKFQALLSHAGEKGIEYVSTGHYAGVGRSPEGIFELRRGSDRGKEQSYFLHRLGQAHLSKSLFPLQDLTKQAVRERALQMGLPSACDPESQEVCFIPGNDYRAFLEGAIGKHIANNGDIRNLMGEKVGEHLGTYRYTIGQRQGLGIASSRPYYVKELRPEENLVVVGRKEDLFTSGLEAEDCSWVAGLPPEGDRSLHAQIRYRHRAAPGRLRVLSPDRVIFEFEEPQWAITPGQALVCYEGDRVLGGGWIKRALG